ncbi:2005_t:CDS:2, partial [Cetraspora pellucida]
MSWQTFVDTNLLGTGNIHQAAIFGLDGTLWATSGGFNPNAEEVKNIIESFDNTEKVQGNGIRCNEKKYYFVSGQETDDRKNYISIHCKQGADGIIAEKTIQAVIIGTYTEGTAAGAANKAVGDLGDYLRGLNY